MKKKDSIALIEVITRAREKRGKLDMTIPQWMGRQSAPGEPPAPGEELPEADESAEVVEGAEPPAVPATPTAPLEAPLGRPIPPRLTLSVSYLTAAVALLVAVVLLGGAFLLGRATAPKGAAVEAASVEPSGESAGGGQAPRTSDSGGGTTTGGQTTPADTEPHLSRQVGKYYLVIQTMLESTEDQQRAAAREIVSFLASRGVEADIWPFGKNLIVWSAKPFDSPTSEAAKQYALQIEKLGQEYRRQGGPYDFRQRSGSGPLKPMYVRAR